MALFVPPNARATDANNNPLPGALWYFYETDTLDLTPIYTTPDLDVEHTNPVEADSGGMFDSIYLDPSVNYRAVLKSAAGVTITDVDPYPDTNSLGSVPVGFGGSLSAALTEGMTSGRTVLLDGTYSLTETLTLTLTGNLHIVATNRTRIEYVSASQAFCVLRIISEGFNVRIDGHGITFDGNDKVAQVLLIEHQLSSGSPTVHLFDVHAENSFIDTGAVSGTASGIKITGKFDLVQVERTGVTNVSRSASWGPGGVCQGFIIDRSAWDQAAKRIIARDVYAINVTLPDPAYSDADGFAFFQNFEDGTECTIDGMYIHNCQGRGYKGQNGSAVPNIENVKIFRDIESQTGGSKDIALQYGQGRISGVHVEYEGADTHDNGTNVIDISHPGTNVNGELDRGFGIVEVDGVTVLNRATASDPIDYVVSTTYSATDTNERLHSFRNIKMLGGTVNALLSLSSLGQEAVAVVEIDNVMVPFGTAASGSAIVFTTGNGAKLDVTLKNVRNMGADTIPVAQDYTGTLDGASSNFGRFLDLGGNYQVAVSDGGINPALPGMMGSIEILGRLLNPSAAVLKSISGLVKVFSLYIADGTTVTLGPYGFTAGNFEFGIVVAGEGAPGRYYCTSGNTTINQERAAGGVTKSDGGSDPGAGLCRVWKDSGTQALKVKLVGDNKLVTFMVFTG